VTTLRDATPPKAPRAVRLDLTTDQSASASLHKPLKPVRAVVLAEPEPFEAIPDATGAEMAPDDRERMRAGVPYGRIFVGALGVLLSLALTLWTQRIITELFAQSPVLGWIGLGVAAIALLAGLIIIARMLRDVLMGRRTDKLRHAAQTALDTRDLDSARAVAAELVGLMARRPETARGRAAFAAASPNLFAAHDVLSIAERELLADADSRVAKAIAKAAKQVSLVTAVSPRALVDVAFVAYACARLLREVAGIYGSRPGPLGLWKLARASFTHLLVTGGLAAGDALLQQVVGQGLAAKLSAKLGEGVLNGLLTARVGLSAMHLCRPLPFIDCARPSLKDVAGELLSGKTDTTGP
jgi:putative membrane protein